MTGKCPEIRPLLNIIAGVLIVTGLSAPASAAVFVLDPTIYCLPSGNCYQPGTYKESYYLEALHHDAIIAFAAAQTYGGRQGHLVAIETEEEYWRLVDHPIRKVYSPLAARMDAGGVYRWIAGPSVGDPVPIFGRNWQAHPACTPFPAVCFQFSDYIFLQTYYTRGWVCGCGVSDEVRFTIEYEAGVTPNARGSWGTLKQIYR